MTYTSKSGIQSGYIDVRIYYSSHCYFHLVYVHVRMCVVVRLLMYINNRFEFVPCNRTNFYVIEIHVKCGQTSEIYADKENKVSSIPLMHMQLLVWC